MSNLGKILTGAAVLAGLYAVVAQPPAPAPVERTASTTVADGVWWHSGGVACYSSVPNGHGYTSDADDATPASLIESSYGRDLNMHVVADHGGEVVIENILGAHQSYFRTEAACLARQQQDDAAERKALDEEEHKYDVRLSPSETRALDKYR